MQKELLWTKDICKLLTPAYPQKLTDAEINDATQALWAALVYFISCLDNDRISPQSLMNVVDEILTGEKEKTEGISLDLLIDLCKESRDKALQSELINEYKKQAYNDHFEILRFLLVESIRQTSKTNKDEIKHRFHETIRTMVQAPIFNYFIYGQGTINKLHLDADERLSETFSIADLYSYFGFHPFQSDHIINNRLDWNAIAEFNSFHPELEHDAFNAIRNRIGFMPVLSLRLRYEKTLRSYLLEKANSIELDTLIRSLRNDHIEGTIENKLGECLYYYPQVPEEKRQLAKSYLTDLLGFIPNPKCSMLAEYLLWQSNLPTTNSKDSLMPFPHIPTHHQAVSIYHYQEGQYSQGTEAARKLPFTGYDPYLGNWHYKKALT